MHDGAFRALADPTRRAILRLLSKQDLSAGELAKSFSISGASMSHHFAALKQAGLVESRREGQLILYSLNTTVLQDLIAHLLDAFPRIAEDSSETHLAVEPK